MSELNNIDKLLKESFDGFAPDAPDVWQGIQQGVQAAQSGSSAGTTTGAVKGGIGIVTKVVGVVAVSASLITGVILYNSSKTETVAENRSTEASTVPDIQVPVDPQVSAPVEALSEAPIVAPENESYTAVTKNDPGNHVVPQHSTTATDARTTSAPIVTLPVNDASTAASESKTTSAVNNNTINNTPGSTPAKASPATTSAALDNTSKGTGPAKQITETSTKKDETNGSPVTSRQPVSESTEEETRINIPNVFTPDGDGINDYHKIVIEREEYYHLQVYDRKGNIVFESRNKENTWNGRDRNTGEMCENGRYYYMFRYKLQGNQSTSYKDGVINLLK